ncbi:hypothetical protein AGR7C_Lc20091 [Agrobacterium deltaense Zutra 3/1]|uniref:Uncharacterized protein n=1 Tax=Agrobacterium deltaense Zutra 3/1 TaxID=1183427 RepID=A0A1S7RL19_9HYPH|nr:hypothetical protein AGR7C_Lc20091 [Agrobacterium deltaense Zutra 3/1]
MISSLNISEKSPILKNRPFSIRLASSFVCAINIVDPAGIAFGDLRHRLRHSFTSRFRKLPFIANCLSLRAKFLSFVLIAKIRSEANRIGWTRKLRYTIPAESKASMNAGDASNKKNVAGPNASISFLINGAGKPAS